MRKFSNPGDLESNTEPVEREPKDDPPKPVDTYINPYEGWFKNGHGLPPDFTTNYTGTSNQEKPIINNINSNN